MKSLKSKQSRNWLITAAVIVACLAAYLGWQHAGPGPAPSPLVGFAKASAQPLDADIKFLNEAERCLVGFWNTKDWNKKISYVHQPSRVGPLMRDYYMVHSHREPSRVTMLMKGVLEISGTRMAHFVFNGQFPDGPTRRLEAVLRRGKDGGIRLDWESYTGAGQMDWTDFTSERRTLPTRMRVWIKHSSYHNYEFEDPRRFDSYSIESPDGEHTLYAFCELGSEAFLKASKMMLNTGGTKTAAIVSISFPAHAQSDNCVKLEDVVADRWLEME